MIRYMFSGLLCALVLVLSAGPLLAEEGPQRITPAAVKARLDSGQPVIFIDTRTGAEWEHSDKIIPGAMRVRGGNEFNASLSRLDKDAFIVTYCT